jgi:hypothetical protein
VPEYIFSIFVDSQHSERETIVSLLSRLGAMIVGRGCLDNEIKFRISKTENVQPTNKPPFDKMMRVGRVEYYEDGKMVLYTLNAMIQE